MRIVLILALFAATFASCAPKVTTQLKRTEPALAANAPVTVIGLKEEAPANATELGTVKIGDSGLSTDCGWNTVIEKAKQAARKAGGNMIKITKHTPPSVFGSSCHLITAKILKTDADYAPPAIATVGTGSAGTATVKDKTPGDYPKFAVGVQGGFSYMTAKISPNVPSDFTSYIKQLKSGSHFGASGMWYFTETLGVGLKYSMFRTKNSMDVIAYDSTSGQSVAGEMRDDITIQYFAPTLGNRIITRNEKTHVNMAVGIGYMGYRNNAKLIDPLKMTGGTVGVHLSLGADFLLNKQWALGVEFAYMGGTLNSMTYDDGTTVETVELPEGQKESLNRIDLSIGIRWMR